MKIQKPRIFPMTMTEERHVLEIHGEEINTEFFEHEKSVRQEQMLKFLLDNYHALRLSGSYPDKMTINFTGTQWTTRLEVIKKKQEVNS